MYHSISEGPGPTCIPLRTFCGHLAALEDNGYQTISMAHFAAWHRGERQLQDRSVVLTFDDGFVDFADAAFPELQKRGWTATVFLPAALVGKRENWKGHLEPTPRRLMDWRQVEELSKQGIDFGGHGMTHADLTQLTPHELCSEVQLPQRLIREHLPEESATCFAPPYGRSDVNVRNEIQRWYELSVGVGFRRADRRCDLYDIPRIEMHYFRDIHRWNRFLEGRAESYFLARRTLRRIRRLF